MNFLAHCLIPDRALEHTHPDLIAGGFVGDFLKGPVPDSLPRELALGIRLHRRIDAYSNRQAAIRTSCERFPARLRRFAPIFVDVIADHLLARQWQHFHPGPLTAFTAQAYAAIEPHVGGLPEPGQRFFEHMREHDLLAGYRDRAVMHRVIGSVIRRLNRPQLHHGLEQIIDERLPELEGDFFAYFPDLLGHASEWLAEQQ
ncbi:MAG: ACP phosphodiesterase [Pseudomonadales bacterium]